MELKDLQSDLEALRELYGFLQCGGDVASKSNIVVLGERSKLLLKNLLDGATKRVLDTHKKTIAAAEYGVSGESCPSESEKCRRALSKFQPYVSPALLKGVPDVSNRRAFSSLKDKDAPSRLTPNEVISLQSRLGFSLDVPKNRKKRCEFNEQSSMKQHSTARSLSKESKQQGQLCDPLGHVGKNMKVVKSNKTMRQTSILGLQGTPNVVASVAGSSRSIASGDDLACHDKKEGEAINNFSKDVDNVLGHIESHISALRLCSKLADATKVAGPHGLANMPTFVPPIRQTKEHLVQKSEPKQAFKPFSDRNELLLSRPESQITGKKDDSNGIHQVFDQSENDLLNDMTSKRRRIQHKEMGQICKHGVRINSMLNKKVGNGNGNAIDMVETGGHEGSQTTGCYVHGQRVPIKQDDVTKRPPAPVKRPFSIPMSNAGKEPTPTIAKLRPRISSESAGSKASLRPFTDKKNLAHQILPKHKKGRKGTLQNRILLQQESEESTTSSVDSSDSEAYSFLSQDSAASISQRSSHGVSSQSAGSKPSLRPFTDKKNLAHQILPKQKKGRKETLQDMILLHQQESEESTTSSSADSSDSEAYSFLSQDSAASISRRSSHGVSEESISSTSSDYRDVGESVRLYPSRTHKPISPANSESEKAEGQRLGQLRRLKNKLGLIFHHHHHHHHHHHSYDQDDSGDHSHSLGVHTKSKWTPLHNLFHHHRNRQDEVDDKLRKARVSNEPVKHEGGHFHALVEGLMQHLRHSKKSKPSSKGLRKGHHHGKRNGKAKKFHWWQTFMSQGGVKLPNKKRVKVGFMSKKQQLKVPNLRQKTIRYGA